MDFAQGFQIWRELGMPQDGSHISFAGLTAISRSSLDGLCRPCSHGVARASTASHLVRKRIGCWPAALRWPQRLSNVILDWPLLLSAVLHTGGCHWWWLTWALAASRTSAAPNEISAPARTRE